MSPRPRCRPPRRGSYVGGVDGSCSWRTRRLAIALGSVAMAAVTMLDFSAVASARSPSVGSVIKIVKAAIKKESGAQLVSTEHTTSSSMVAKETLSAGTASGEETLSNGDAHLAVKVTPADAYVSGSSSGLTTILGVSAKDAKKIGSDWVYWKHGTAQYTDLESDVTVTSLTSVLPKAKGTKLSTHVTKGATFYVLAWTTEATSSSPKLSNTLTVSVRTDLPVRSTSTTSGGTRLATKFSDWGRHVVVSAPPAGSTVPSSTITG